MKLVLILLQFQLENISRITTHDRFLFIEELKKACFVSAGNSLHMSHARHVPREALVISFQSEPPLLMPPPSHDALRRRPKFNSGCKNRPFPHTSYRKKKKNPKIFGILVTSCPKSEKFAPFPVQFDLSRLQVEHSVPPLESIGSFELLG